MEYPRIHTHIVAKMPTNAPTYTRTRNDTDRQVKWCINMCSNDEPKQNTNTNAPHTYSLTSRTDANKSINIREHSARSLREKNQQRNSWQKRDRANQNGKTIAALHQPNIFSATDYFGHRCTDVQIVALIFTARQMWRYLITTIDVFQRNSLDTLHTICNTFSFDVKVQSSKKGVMNNGRSQWTQSRKNRRWPFLAELKILFVAVFSFHSVCCWCRVKPEQFHTA